MEFGDLVRRSSVGINLSEQHLIHKFLHSLTDRRLLPHLTVQTFHSLEDAVLAAHLLSGSYRAIRPTSTTSNRDS